MGRCKNCRFWKEQGVAYSHTMLITVCDAEVYEGDTQHEVYAEALDDSGMNVALITGPEFGCVNYEGK